MDVTVLSDGRRKQIEGGATVGSIALTKDAAFAAVSHGSTVAYSGEDVSSSSKLLQHTMPVHVAALSPDGGFVASGSEDGSAQIMDARTGRRIAVAPIGASVAAAAFKDETVLLVLSRDGKLRIVDFAARGGLESVRSATGRIVDISPTGRYFATWNVAGDVDHELIVNDRLGKRLWTLKISGDAFLPNAAFGFSQDEKSFTVADPQTGVSVYDAGSGAVLHHSGAATAPSTATAVSGDGKSVAWASGNVVRLWRLDAAAPGARPRDIQPPSGLAEITSLALSNDGSLLAAAGSGQSSNILVFNTKSSSWSNPMAARGAIAQAIFSTDGATLLTTSSDALTTYRMPEGSQLWAIETPAEIRNATHASFNINDSEIALMDLINGRIALAIFDAKSGQMVSSMAYPANDKLDGLRRALAFDDDAILAADTISIARIPRTSQALIRAACAILSRNITAEEWKTVQAPPAKTCPELP